MLFGKEVRVLTGHLSEFFDLLFAVAVQGVPVADVFPGEEQLKTELVLVSVLDHEILLLECR
jgi:hypothetical protein